MVGDDLDGRHRRELGLELPQLGERLLVQLDLGVPDLLRRVLAPEEGLLGRAVDAAAGEAAAAGGGRPWPAPARGRCWVSTNHSRWYPSCSAPIRRAAHTFETWEVGPGLPVPHPASLQSAP